MPRSLEFQFKGETQALELDKVDRSELYGSVRVETLDMDGQRCELATLLDDGKTLIPNGGTALAYINTDGEWVERKHLTPVDSEGETLEEVPSSFDAPIELGETVDEETFLEHSIRLIYRLQSEDGIAQALAGALDSGTIFHFPFSYRGGIDPDAGFLLRGDDGTPWMLVGNRNTLNYIDLEQAGVIAASEGDDDGQEEDDEDILDFGMF